MSKELEEKKFYVYMYTSPSGKHYVGRTCQSQKQRSHKNGEGYKVCSAFWNAIQKYGWENFKYEVLEEDISANNIDERENYWIDYYHSSADENGYNLLKPNGTFKVASNDLKERLSNIRKGKNNPLYGKHHPFPKEALERAVEVNNKPVMQFDLNGNYIQTFKSRRDASNFAHCQEVNIGKCCLGKHKQAGGYQWCNVGDEDKINKYHSNVETRGEIAQVKDGIIINIFKNARVAMKSLGKTHSASIYKCLSGERKRAFGYEWISIDDLKPNMIEEYYSMIKNEVNDYAS